MGDNMPEINQTKEQLLKRRDEILGQLNRASENIREEFELDPDPEEQAIQLEQDEVLIGIEANLQKELAEVEDKLLDFE
jgi:RNA polymerase-binding transcription factor DksA